MRFNKIHDDYIRVQKELALEGVIVISVDMFGHQEGLGMGGDTKKGLDELHLRKINASDGIFVVNAKILTCLACGKPCKATEWCNSECCAEECQEKPYIGESTRREIEYAKATGKAVFYMNSVE